MVAAHGAVAQKNEELHACVQGRVIGAAGPLHPCIPCIELYYQRYSHHFHSSEGLTSSFLLLDLLLPQFYTVDELGHTIEVLVTPFGAAIIEGPISVLRYVLRVALRAMRW